MSTAINGMGSMGAPDFSQMQEMREKMFKKADANSDGVLSKDEFNASRPQDDRVDFSTDDLFSKIDTDGDGSITQTEMDTAAEQMHNRMQAFGPPPPPPGEESDSSAESTSMKAFKEFLKQIMESAKKLRSSASDSGLSDDSISSFVDQIKQYATDYYNSQNEDSSSTSLDSFLANIEKEAKNFTSSLSNQIQLNTKYSQY